MRAKLNEGSRLQARHRTVRFFLGVILSGVQCGPKRGFSP